MTPITVIWFSVVILVIALIVMAVAATIIRLEMERADDRELQDQAGVSLHLFLESYGAEGPALRGAGARQDEQLSCRVPRQIQHGYKQKRYSESTGR
jgi:hypothetical protein